MDYEMDDWMDVWKSGWMDAICLFKRFYVEDVFSNMMV